MSTKQPLQFYSEPLAGVNCDELQGKLIVIEGPDAVGRSTQITRLAPWLEQRGHAVLHTGMAKEGHTLGPITMTLFYTTDFADRLENEIVPALRAGFVVLTDRYIFSIIARAIARGEDSRWIEQVAGFALVPHLVCYLRCDVKDLVSRVVLGRGAFDYWESGMDMRFGRDMYESFVKYQTRLIRALDRMSGKYGFNTIDASQQPDDIFRQLQRQISTLFRSPRRRLPRERKTAAASPQGA